MGESKCDNCMKEKATEELKEILSKYTHDKSNLIQILNEAQEKFGYIPTFVQEEIAKYLVIVIFLMFVVFTFIPPKIGIFKDEVTSTYGVFEFKY